MHFFLLMRVKQGSGIIIWLCKTRKHWVLFIIAEQRSLSLDIHHFIFFRKTFGWHNMALFGFSNELHWSHNLQEENFHWNLNFAISPMANLLNLNSACYVFRNLTIKAYIIWNSKSKICCYWSPWIWPIWARLPN